MRKTMGEPQVNFAVNGQSQVPPGFRFHPTEEELLRYYLRKKVNSKKIDLDVIPEVDLNKFEPWDIQEKCRIGSGPQNDWYFFSHKDKKYPTGTRTNRATVAGFWKATGRDKAIYSNSKRIGMRKTLVFYKGRAPHGQKSDWIMHEYRMELDDHSQDFTAASGSLWLGETASSEDGWVVCRVFKKKNYLKAVGSNQNPCNSLDTTSTLNGLLVCMKRSCMYESDNIYHSYLTTNQFNLHEGFESGFKHLPPLENPLSLTSAQDNNSSCYNVNLTDHCPINADVMVQEMEGCGNHGTVSEYDHQRGDGISDWAALDRLVASQLNGQPKVYCQNGNENEDDFWSYGRSLSSDPLCHLFS